LTANKSVTPEIRQSNLQGVDNLKSAAHALNEQLAKKEKGVAEAGALIKQALLVIQANAKYTLSSAAASAWTPLRGKLGKVAWAYEVNDKNLPYQ
jgi:hypothetical protein